MKYITQKEKNGTISVEYNKKGIKEIELYSSLDNHSVVTYYSRLKKALKKAKKEVKKLNEPIEYDLKNADQKYVSAMEKALQNDPNTSQVMLGIFEQPKDQTFCDEVKEKQEKQITVSEAKDKAHQLQIEINKLVNKFKQETEIYRVDVFTETTTITGMITKKEIKVVAKL